MKDAPVAPTLGDELAHWLARVRLDPPQRIGTLEIHPVRLEGEPGKPYLLLHEAIATKALEVVETVSEDVNEVVARNVGDRPVLILEGESVHGAKQNRVITVDILIAAGTQVSVFVGCVEQGRWDENHSAFESGEMAAEPELRRSIRQDSSADGKPHQGKLWGAVARKLGRSDTKSPSSDYYAFMKRFKARVAEVSHSLTTAPDQVGILVTEGGRLVGFDLLGHPRNWGAVADRLSHSYVLGSLHEDGELDGVSAARRPEEWLERIAHAGVALEPTEGLGVRFKLTDDSIIGGGLWHEGRAVHLAAFGFKRLATPGGWVAT